MPFPPFMQAGLDKVLQTSVNIDAITNNAGSLSKLGGILHKHFCTPAQHLLPAYRNSYQDTLKALRFALNPPYVPLHSKIIKDFQQDVKTAFLPAFPHTQLYKALAKECQSLEKQLLFSQASLQVGTKQAFEADLAALVGSKTLPNLTELILEDVQNRVEISTELLELLRLEDLLGCGIWHFLRADKQLSLLIAALQQEEIFQRVKRIDENVEEILEKVDEVLDSFRKYHRAAEHGGNDYANSESAKALEKAEQQLAREKEKSCLSGLTQAMKSGNPKQARELMQQALKLAKTEAEKALVHYSLFKLAVSEKNPDVQQAFEHLQQAIKLDEAHYAPCDPYTFEIQALLGVGGMGYALLARSGAVELVVKCFWQELENKQLAEAEKMQQVQGSYVPSLFGKGIYRHQKRLCLVTHYLPQAVDGARWLAQHDKLEESVGLVVAIRLAEALQAIHAVGVLHLDLKPANVLLLPAASAENWEVRVIDFGLSKLLPKTKEVINNSSTVTATLKYASPEQIEALPMTTASDVYSYGKTLFDLLGDIQGFDVPPQLQAVLAKCLKNKPEERIILNVLLTELTSLHGGKIHENPTDSSAAQAELERLRREQAKREQQAAAKLAKEREELARQQREYEEKLKQDQAHFEKEKADLERKKREHEEQTRLAQEAAELERKKQGNDKGIARTFSTVKAGKREDFTVYVNKSGQVVDSFGVKAGKREDFTVYEKTFDIKGTQLVMVYVPAGEFMMGSNDGDEKPVHKVKIEQAFYMGKFPVTQAQYKAVMGENPSNWKGDNLPVESLYWKQAREFCQKLSALLKNDFRLPSESEWEYACRAGTSTEYWWGDEMEDGRCWYDGNSGGKTHFVDEKVNEHTNPFGLCDMSGNVREWCEDNWEGNYKTPRTQAAYKNSNENRLLRGGSWYNFTDDCRSAYRNYGSSRGDNCGFRVVSFPSC